MRRERALEESSRDVPMGEQFLQSAICRE